MKTDRWEKFLDYSFIAVAIILTVAAILGGVTLARGQTPPVSMVVDMPDTSTSMDLEICFTVSSTIPWDAGGGVGLYYRIPGTTDWLYGAWGYESPLTWTAPVDNATYEFYTQVEDNDGNAEGYNQDPEAATFVCTSCEGQPDFECPPMSTLEMVQSLAAAGFDLEADTPMLQYYWTHPTTGSQVVTYIAEWEVDGIVSTLPDIPFEEPEVVGYGSVCVPVTIGQAQRLRVRGKDAEGREGPWSAWSAMWVDDGPPGEPGQVQRTLIMVD